MAKDKPNMGGLDRAKAKAAASERLLGDRLAVALQKLGVDRVAKAFTAVTGLPCGCGKRRNALNRWDVARRSSSIDH